MADLNLIYFKELPSDEQNEFTANLSKSNEIGEFFLRKSNKHLLTNLKKKKCTTSDKIVK